MRRFNPSFPIATLLWLGLGLGLGLAGRAEAQACGVNNIQALNFGVYSPPAAAPTDSTSQFNVVCIFGRPALSIALSAGGAGTFTPRTLFQGSETLAYNLFREPARVSIWGNGTGGTQVVTSPGGPFSFINNRGFVVYGRVPAGQWVAAGGYSDTIVITITF